MLTVSDFAGWFSAIHGHPPFPWQARLLQQVVERGWPSLLDLPTGSGKTAAMDVAVFHMALEGTKKIAERRAPRRVVFVVDRRVVVDQAYVRARKLVDKLANSLAKPKHEPDVLASVARALKELSATETPLACAMLRGGMPRDTSWLRSPDLPLIVVSTVDQVGSRLLFRGYGVSDRMLPVHAGLFAADALFLLDEVHLSQPFKRTLEAVEKYRKSGFADREPGAPFQVVQLSATADDPGKTVFRLGKDDRDPDKAPELVKRLEARKPVRLEEVKVTGNEASRKAILTAKLVEEARKCARSGARTIAIVVNQVDTARRVLSSLRSEGAGALDDEEARTNPELSAIVTGRMRPLDQMDAYVTLAPWIEAGRPRQRGEQTLYLVATQCIEAGADLDFDALVTELASIDALRQRFGRLDRMGELKTKAQGVLVARSDVTSGKDERVDPIYGKAATETWKWLQKQPSLDFGIDAFPHPTPEQLKDMIAPRGDAPFLLPAHLDAFVQTGPRPAIEPVPSLWLHGPERDAAEVTLVWREDVREADLQRGHEPGVSQNERRRVLERLVDRIDFVPPSALEALAVPLWAAQAWLRSQHEPPVADVDALAGTVEEQERAPERSKLALRWKGDESTILDVKEPRPGEELRPGDVLVVPCSYGGLTSGVWDPSSKEPVMDLGDRAQLVQRGRPVARPGVGGLLLLTEEERTQLLELHEERRNEEALALVRRPDELWRRIAFELLPKKGMEVLPQEDGWIALGRRPSRKEIEGVAHALRKEGRGDLADETCPERFSTDPETSAFTGRSVLLSEHSRSVGSMARAFARRLGLGEALEGDLWLAGYLHDQGKADPRFQAWLRDGSRFLVEAGAPLLAKSAKQAEDRAARRATRQKSGYPEGARHEMLSVALVERDATLRARANDWNLVLHLVASHHGYARPFAPAVRDEPPIQVKVGVPIDGAVRLLEAPSNSDLAGLDSGVPERFWRLTRTYGWFGLAWLESILRLADHRASEADEEEAAKSDAEEAS